MYDPQRPLTPKVVLVVVAHPDDIEFCVGGSVARWIREGAEVSYLVLTDGSIGSQDRAAKGHLVAAARQDEQRRAARSLGVQDTFFCDYQDCALDPRNNVKRDIVRVIRKVRPDTVITFDPTMVYSLSRGEINHTDHRAAGQATLDAIFPLARDYHSFPELTDKEKLEPHKVTDVLLINYDSANYYIDITDFLEAKLAALAEHQSQFNDVDGVKALVREYAQSTAQASQTGADYAEGFIRLTMPA
jgi:LmbE family N-acetylglucosaminyl deacetylase